MENDYQSVWFKTFLQQYSPEQTATEVGFVSDQLPQSAYKYILDLCCGEGRHSYPLAKNGYKVTGIDLSAEAIANAPVLTKDNPRYLPIDMRDIAKLSGNFDAVVSLWQSFGYFDSQTNEDLLKAISKKLNPQGRLILDIYNSEFFENHTGSITFEKDQMTITETKTIKDDRLTVHLDYGEKIAPSIFNWQLFTPEKITDLARSSSMDLVVACTNFDANQAVSPDRPRMQLVFQKQ